MMKSGSPLLLAIMAGNSRSHWFKHRRLLLFINFAGNILAVLHIHAPVIVQTRLAQNVKKFLSACGVSLSIRAI
jgi:hypothetical protein